MRIKTMKFSSDMYQAIEQGKKTVTRRRVKSTAQSFNVGDLIMPIPVINILRTDADAPAMPLRQINLKVVSVEMGMFNCVDEVEARKEGFKSKREFRDFIQYCYGIDIYMRGMCWVINFEVIE